MQELYILGAKINDLSLAEVMNKIQDFLTTDKKGYVVTPNPEICLISYADKNFRRKIQLSFISIPDGFGLKIGALFWGNILKNTTTGIDLCQATLKFAEQDKYSILLLGGQAQTGEMALEKLQKQYPNLKLDYLNGGVFNQKGQSADSNLIDKINLLNPDIIFVNLGAPKQEYFMADNLPELKAKLMFGVGGSLDFLSGKTKRAPKWLRKIGLEWLWRLIQEPWRWTRIFKAVVIFPIQCAKFRLYSLFVYRKNVAGFIINDQKQILIAKQAKYHYWQIPQGGAKNAKTKEEYSQAVLREMKQEVGTNKFIILDWQKNCFKYRWPKKDTYFDHFKGQKQSLFLLKFTGQDADIKLDHNEHIDYQWVSKDEILSKVIDFKKPLIQIALTKFNKYL